MATASPTFSRPTAGSRTSTPITTSGNGTASGIWAKRVSRFIGYDVNHDGKIDLIYGRGHSYGLYWLEQQGDAAHRRWVRATPSMKSFSQVHALALADIDGDGEPELHRRQTLPRA